LNNREEIIAGISQRAGEISHVPGQLAGL